MYVKGINTKLYCCCRCYDSIFLFTLKRDIYSSHFVIIVVAHCLYGRALICDGLWIENGQRLTIFIYLICLITSSWVVDYVDYVSLLLVQKCDGTLSAWPSLTCKTPKNDSPKLISIFFWLLLIFLLLQFYWQNNWCRRFMWTFAHPMVFI